MHYTRSLQNDKNSQLLPETGRSVGRDRLVFGTGGGIFEEDGLKGSMSHTETLSGL